MKRDEKVAKGDAAAESEGVESGARKTCFVIGPIGEHGSENRKHADLLLDFIIEPALAAASSKYIVRRADNLGESGIITNQITRHLVEDDLVIADLSHQNPNAFYELAVRHGSGKPFVHVNRTQDKPPFDITTNRSVPFDLTDLRSVEAAKKELIAQIESIESGSVPDSPLSFVLTTPPTGDGDPRDLTLQRILSAVTALNRQSENQQKLKNVTQLNVNRLDVERSSQELAIAIHIMSRAIVNMTPGQNPKILGTIDAYEDVSKALTLVQHAHETLSWLFE